MEKLAKHYEAGADFVIINSKVPNTETVYARFAEFQHQFLHRGRSDMYYSEGFSCRRELAIKVGIFDNGKFPVKFCRDWTLGKKMLAANYKKVYDPSLFVFHKAPDNFEEYWVERKERGRFSAFVQYFFLHKPLLPLFFKFLAKDIKFLLRFITVVPGFFYAFRLSRYSAKSLKDLFPLWWLYFLQELGQVFGEWEGFLIDLKHPRIN